MSNLLATRMKARDMPPIKTGGRFVSKNEILNGRMDKIAGELQAGFLKMTPRVPENGGPFLI